MQKGFGQLLIIVGIIILVGIAGGIYYLKYQRAQPISSTFNLQGQKDCEAKTGKKCAYNLCQESMGSGDSKSQNEKKKCIPGWYSYEQPSSTPNSEQTKDDSDETANWKTYVDPQKRFQFKYPNNWNYAIKGETHPFLNLNIYTDLLVSSPIIIPGTHPLIYELSLSIKPNNENKSLEQVVNEVLKGPEKLSLINRKNITIDAKKAEWLFVSGGLGNTIIIDLLHNGNVYHFTYNTFFNENLPEARSEEFMQTLDKILSTFKFIDSETSSE